MEIDVSDVEMTEPPSTQRMVEAEARALKFSDPDDLRVPEEKEDCIRLVKLWESFGFGKYQIHYERHGRVPKCPEDTKENERSREIRVRH